MGSEPLKIIQISDMHLFADTEGELLGVKTQESFQAVIDFLQIEAEKMDLILLSGDLSQDASEMSYRRIANSLKIFNVPIYCVPGNHDNVSRMTAVYPLEQVLDVHHIVLKHWHLILLNSQKLGAIGGHLANSQLNFMQECLQAYPDHYGIIVFHHQPLVVGCKWLDHIGLSNADEFWQKISHYPKVNTILFGHVHQEFEQEKNRIKCYSAPSTCFQFKRNQNHFGLENLAPGYRWIHLYEDGHLETGIKRIAQYIGKFESKAKGY